VANSRTAGKTEWAHDFQKADGQKNKVKKRRERSAANNKRSLTVTHI